MDYHTIRNDGGCSYPAFYTSYQTPRLDGLPTGSEALISAYSQDQDKTSASSFLKKENFVNSLSKYSKAKETPNTEQINQSRYTGCNTECKFYFYLYILNTDLLLVESSPNPDFELLDYTTSRTPPKDIPKFARAKFTKSSKIKDKKYKGMFIDILIFFPY